MVSKPVLLAGCGRTEQAHGQHGICVDNTRLEALAVILRQNKEGLVVTAMYDFEESIASWIPIHYLMLPTMVQNCTGLLMIRYEIY